MTRWTRLIRFTPVSSPSRVLYGEPLASSYEDIGAVLSIGKLQARVIDVGSEGPLAEDAVVTDKVEQVGKLLSPLSIRDCPGIKCIGLNYKKHIKEGGRAPPPHPSLFLKPSTCLSGYDEAVPIPKIAQEDEADHEIELCVVIGKDAKDVTRENALEYVAGYTVGNDVSARKWQRNPERAGGVPQWCFAKNFDQWAPMGPCIVSTEIIPDPGKLHMSLSVNGETRQETPTSDLLFDVPAIIAFLSQGTTLPRGTIIMTGTPSGVSCTGPESTWRPLRHGDDLELRLSEVGVLRHGIAYD